MSYVSHAKNNSKNPDKNIHEDVSMQKCANSGLLTQIDSVTTHEKTIRPTALIFFQGDLSVVYNVMNPEKNTH